MSREIFQDLLEKYHKGLCTDAEKKIVEQWYRLLDAEDAIVEPEELASLEQKLWDKINLHISEEEPVSTLRSTKKVFTMKRILRFAAVIGIAVPLLLLFMPPAHDQNATFLTENADALKTIYNVSSRPKVITLEDGSRVTLEPKARLTFPSHFLKSRREVSLVGNGFFLISKNPKRPFLVYNKHIVTRVLGTSFSIRLNPNTNETEVTVKTGKVLVTPNTQSAVVSVPVLFTKPKGVTLVPNEKTIYNVAKEGFKTTLADNPVPVLKAQSGLEPLSFTYNDALVKDVVAGLTKTYGVQIVLNNDELKDVTFTGDLSTLNLYNKLDFLCQSIAANYRVEGTRILITKK
jgi:transmembrane sensor